MVKHGLLKTRQRINAAGPIRWECIPLGFACPYVDCGMKPGTQREGRAEPVAKVNKKLTHLFGSPIQYCPQRGHERHLTPGTTQHPKNTNHPLAHQVESGGSSQAPTSAKPRKVARAVTRDCKSPSALEMCGHSGRRNRGPSKCLPPEGPTQLL